MSWSLILPVGLAERMDDSLDNNVLNTDDNKDAEDGVAVFKLVEKTKCLLDVIKIAQQGLYHPLLLFPAS